MEKFINDTNEKKEFGLNNLGLVSKFVSDGIDINWYSKTLEKESKWLRNLQIWCKPPIKSH